LRVTLLNIEYLPLHDRVNVERVADLAKGTRVWDSRGREIAKKICVSLCEPRGVQGIGCLRRADEPNGRIRFLKVARELPIQFARFVWQ
jgi:hypothetical protein